MPPRKSRKPRKQNKKRNFRRQRALVVETKKRELEQINIRNSQNGAGVTFSAYYPSTIKLTNMTSELSMLPIRPFYRMSKGDRADQMIGNEVFSKSLYLKGKILGLPANNSVEAYLVTGWVKDRLGFTDFTTPTVANAVRQDVEDFIYNQVRQHFDSSTDEMRYRTAKKDNIHILKYKKLTHPADANFNDDIDFKAFWKTQRKVVYTQCRKALNDGTLGGNNQLFVESNNNSGGGGGNLIDVTDQAKDETDTLGGDIGQFLPLNSWLPFALIYCPKFADISPGTLALQFNAVHYFQG
jgi:hypothetical protein